MRIEKRAQLTADGRRRPTEVLANADEAERVTFSLFEKEIQSRALPAGITTLQIPVCRLENREKQPLLRLEFAAQHGD
jgi:hypothetical protein